MVRASSTSDLVCIILAGGKGTRMRSSSTHKACFPIAGTPAILRAIDAYRTAGVSRFQIVVGTMAEQVMDTVGRAYPDVNFVYQSEQRGTGHATRIGVGPLRLASFDGQVLVTMGDKLISPRMVSELVANFNNGSHDAVVGVLPAAGTGAEGGRILLHGDGSFAGIIEKKDLDKAQVLNMVAQLVNDAMVTHEVAATLEEVVSHANECFADKTKRRLALGELADILETRDWSSIVSFVQESARIGEISLGASSYSITDIQQAPYRNAALYLFRAEALYDALQHLNTENAQGEEYLTDCLNYLANTRSTNGEPKYKVGFTVLEPDEVLTYNNPEELLVVEDKVRATLKTRVVEDAISLPASVFRTAGEWLSILDYGGSPLESVLADIYGPDKSLWQERIHTFREALQSFARSYGANRKVIVVRAPGRINMMGRHIEHRGGTVNVMAISKEAVLVAAPREDDVVRIANTSPTEYPETSFQIGQELTDMPWDNWVDYIDHERVRKLVYDSQGLWINYIKAAFLRLQFQFKDIRLNGMDAVYTGNIPVAAGLSSSSAVVVASAEAAATLNRLDVTPQDFVDLCGEGEWYVGSRGGAGDHAAMKFSRRGQVTQIGFYPFEVRGSVPFPDGYSLVIANSHIKARKMTNAKNVFNQRVASYEFGLMLLRERYPKLARRMERLRDVSPGKLGVLTSELYDMLLSLPESMSPQSVVEQLGRRYSDDIPRIMRSHAAPNNYLIRSVVLYGIAECQRAERCHNLLEQGDLSTIGRLMSLSHDGDRVARFTGAWPALLECPYDYTASDSYLHGLVADLRSEDPVRVSTAQLFNQPGGYACSTPEIDMMVDIAKQVPGVLGAQLSGAGLGGCVMVLVANNSIPALSKVLTEKFYEPRQLEPEITTSVPVKGSGLLQIE